MMLFKYTNIAFSFFFFFAFQKKGKFCIKKDHNYGLKSIKVESVLNLT